MASKKAEDENEIRKAVAKTEIKEQTTSQIAVTSIENPSDKKKESVYTVDEFCNNALTLFGTMPECVRAALKEKGITQCGKTEAEEIVEVFIKKEVK